MKYTHIIFCQLHHDVKEKRKSNATIVEENVAKRREEGKTHDHNTSFEN